MFSQMLLLLHELMCVSGWYSKCSLKRHLFRQCSPSDLQFKTRIKQKPAIKIVIMHDPPPGSILPSKIRKSNSCIFSKYYLWYVNNKKMKMFYWANFFMTSQCEGVKRGFLSIFSRFSYDFRNKIDFI